MPLNGLRVLDAAARHLSFTRAADELAVTPAAVGQQIRALEDTLGTVLFRRTTRGLELTPEAENGLPALREGFLQFEESVRAMRAGQSSTTLTVAAPRDLTAKWLSARIADYRRQAPDTSFRLMATDGAVDFTEANLDLAMLWTTGPGEHEGAPVCDGSVSIVAAPDGAADAGLIGWAGGEVDGAALVVADAGLAIDAAAAGLGRARVPSLLAAADVAAGRVVELDREAGGELRYWLVAPLPQWRQKKVRSLVDAWTQKAEQAISTAS
nr:LysR family transcriptional regulator [Sphingomonas jejuensis]